MPDEQTLESFIGNSFRSVWALEVVQYLADHPGASFAPEDLVAALRVSDAVISQSVENLLAAGLVVVDRDGGIALHEGNPERTRLVQRAVELYQKSPDRVRRLIVARTSPGATAFANAFKLRKD